MYPNENTAAFAVRGSFFRAGFASVLVCRALNFLLYAGQDGSYGYPAYLSPRPWRRSAHGVPRGGIREAARARETYALARSSDRKGANYSEENYAVATRRSLHSLADGNVQGGSMTSFRSPGAHMSLLRSVQYILCKIRITALLILDRTARLLSCTGAGTDDDLSHPTRDPAGLFCFLYFSRSCCLRGRGEGRGKGGRGQQLLDSASSLFLRCLR